jgi:hypothetical protein
MNHEHHEMQQSTITKAASKRRLFLLTLPRWSSLLQLRVLGFGLFEDGDVGVGVFPQRQKIFVGG